MTQLEEIKYHFFQNHIKLKVDWLRDVISFLLDVKKITNNLLDFVYHQWLFSNIKFTSEPFREFEHSENIYVLPQPFVFQIHSITDIGTPKLKQYNVKKDYDEGINDNSSTNNDYKCIFLEISDGQRIFKAFEQKRIPLLSLSTPSGCKVLIFGGTLFIKNMFFLNSKNCQFLGGAVEELKQQNSPIHSITGKLNKPLQTTQLEEIKYHFFQNHIKLKVDWLRDVISFLLDVKKITNNLLDFVYHQWLFSNIKFTSEPFREFEHSENIYVLPQPFVFQIHSVTDIGTPKLKQYNVQKDCDEGIHDNSSTNNIYKCFFFEISDGQRIFKAFEQKQIPHLSLSTPLGCKILIFGGAFIIKGVFFLHSKNCQLLGGAVEELNQQQSNFI